MARPRRNLKIGKKPEPQPKPKKAKQGKAPKHRNGDNRIYFYGIPASTVITIKDVAEDRIIFRRNFYSATDRVFLRHPDSVIGKHYSVFAQDELTYPIINGPRYIKSIVLSKKPTFVIVDHSLHNQLMDLRATMGSPNNEGQEVTSDFSSRVSF